MRVDDVANAHAAPFGGLEIGGGVPERIDNRAGGSSAAAKKVRHGNWIGVEELAQDHAAPPCFELRQPEKVRLANLLTMIAQYSIIRLNDIRRYPRCQAKV
jgi:hypothetical protein